MNNPNILPETQTENFKEMSKQFEKLEDYISKQPMSENIKYDECSPIKRAKNFYYLKHDGTIFSYIYGRHLAGIITGGPDEGPIVGDTPRGKIVVNIGEYLIKKDSGEIFSCSQDKFDKMIGGIND